MTDRLTDELLAELERLCVGATPGPWEVVGLSGAGGPLAIRMPYEIARRRVSFYGIQMIGKREDAEFIASARDALPALIAEVRALRRVAEAALELLRDPRTRRIDAIAHLERFVAEWRRVSGREIEERER